ncbi:MAG: enterochelin esterase [Deltaproteobacteria bacterium]|nr:enterochelin esterase [Deltaproteobacteria bacterium]MBU47976.1 enterochelin esterase [Deltaproteobacteria bacterium]
MRSRLQRMFDHPPTPKEIDEFIRDNTFPIVEGTNVTFVYRGNVEAVYLKHWVYGLSSSQAFSRVSGTDLWMTTLEIPKGSRVEYKFEVVHHGHRTWIRDPFNPHIAYDPFGGNSVCQGAGYETPDWVLNDPEAREGTLHELQIDSEAFGDTRHFTMYHPARFRTRRRYPLLIVHDGGDYLHYSSMKTVLDNLIHRNEVAPMLVAFTHPKKRLNEYPDNLSHSRYIVEELLPFLEGRYRLYPQAARRGLMGASFGGVATLSTAWRYPGVFGRLLLQSGSFAFTDIGEHQRGPAFDPVVKFVNAFREEPGKPSDKVFMSCGMYESLIYENRSIFPLLQDTGMEVMFSEDRDGHNWMNWRDRLRDALTWLFPGPLWMIYE